MLTLKKKSSSKRPISKKKLGPGKFSVNEVLLSKEVIEKLTKSKKKFYLNYLLDEHNP